MKVAFVSYHNFSQPGGVKNHILGLYHEYKKRGVDCKIIMPKRKKIENYGNDFILLGTSFPLTFSGSSSDFALCFNPWVIKNILEKQKFDVLHFHNFGLSSWQIMEQSSSLNILTFHASLEGNEFLKKHPILLQLLEKIAIFKIDGIIGVAPFNLDIFKNYQGPKTIIPNGIDLRIFNPKVPKLKKFQDKKINILFLGRIEERKGLIYLLKAFKILKNKFSDIRLIVVGEGPLKKECQDWVNENQLTDVLFEGFVKEEIIPSYYNSCDIYVSPAIFGESFGIVLIEAMACQKPVVAFANQGYKTVLTGKGSRFLVGPKDVKGLAEKIEIKIKN